ncbi:MAG: hypothetical protein JWO67_3808 [Streptosporangiaceae bacterium]|nr:hypothetical protein [Streptosporangiaceae bacterium]
MTASVFGAQDADKALVPTGIKTASYTAAASDLVPVDTTGGPVTITMPTAPVDRARVAVKLVAVAGGHTVTVAGGGATFNDAGGTSLTLQLLNQGLIAQYDLALNVWYVLADDLPLSQLDLRYAGLAGATFTGHIAPAVVSLADAATIAIDAAAGNDFRVTLGGSRVLGNPSNPVDGQKILVWVTQDPTGSRTLSYGTAFAFAASLAAPTLSTAPGAVDVLGFEYFGPKNKWLLMGYNLDY